jgi:hypothetical protein
MSKIIVEETAVLLLLWLRLLIFNVWSPLCAYVSVTCIKLPVLFLIACMCSSNMKHLTCLPCVFQWATHTFHLAYTTFLIRIYSQVGFYYILCFVTCSSATFISNGNSGYSNHDTHMNYNWHNKNRKNREKKRTPEHARKLSYI